MICATEAETFGMDERLQRAAREACRGKPRALNLVAELPSRGCLGQVYY
jgi:hypothetical protein